MQTSEEEADPAVGLAAPLGSWMPQQAFGEGSRVPLPTHEAAASTAALDAGWAALQAMRADPSAEFQGTEEQFQSAVSPFSGPSAGFTAGRPAQRFAAWQRHLTNGTSAGAALTPAAKHALAWVGSGVKFDFVPTSHPAQRGVPLRQKKMGIITRALQGATQRGDITPWLSGRIPSAVAFPNHRSAEEYAEFTTTAIQAGVALGAMAAWGGAAPPTVINGIRVVDDNPAKLRFCINPMYVNAHIRHMPLTYEGLRDVQEYVSPEDFMSTLDDTKGYWHIPLHPSMWQFTAFQWQGRVYCFTHLPFGISSACWIYTTVKQAVYQPLRRMGMRLTHMIDDVLLAGRGRGRAMLVCFAEMAISFALGFYRGVDKCKPLPLQRQLFLGLTVDAAQQLFEVPPPKAADFEAKVAAVAAAGGASARQVACLAGKMMAMSLAVTLAPLFSRAVHKAWEGRLAWDQVLPTPHAMSAALQLFVEQLRRANGKRWHRRTRRLLVVGDASDSQAAAFTPGGEVAAPIIRAFSLAEQAASSTTRELLACLAALQLLLQRYPHLLVGGTFVYQTDSRNTLTNVMGMRGGASTFALVREIRLLAAAHDVELDLEWQPRTHPLAQQADALSKVEDACDWALHPEVYQGILGCQALGGRTPTLDAFAASHNTKVQGAYFSAHWAPGALAVDAFEQPWALRNGQRQLVFVNPPFGRLGEALVKIQRERVDSIVVGPGWQRWWQAVLVDLPVRQTWTLPHRPDVFVPGVLLPAAHRTASHPRYAVHVWIIVWPS
jgi:hypothetical protein